MGTGDKGEFGVFVMGDHMADGSGVMADREFGVFVMGDHMADGSGVMADSGGRVNSISSDFSALQSTSQVGASVRAMPFGLEAAEAMRL